MGKGGNSHNSVETKAEETHDNSNDECFSYWFCPSTCLITRFSQH